MIDSRPAFLATNQAIEYQQNCAKSNSFILF